jgi:uncharacterized protein (DUF697 family)/GTP-binding protein EngB required for normal cell division
MNEDNTSDLFKNAIDKAMKEKGHLNVLIAGRTGIGKSTLINSVFRKNLAETGAGKPVTPNTAEIKKEGIPLSIFDTRGLEMSAFEETMGELESLITERCEDIDPNKHIHVAWLCILEDGRRVEEAEIKLHQMLSDYVPVLVVITKARDDNGFKAKVQKLLPKARNVLRVRAISERLDEGITLKPMGLQDLVEATSELIPDGIRRAFAASQKVSIKYKKDQAHKMVIAAAALAAAAGASPIPFSDAAILAPIQIGMIAKISSVFGMELSSGALSTLVSSTIGVTGAAFAGRAIVSGIFKMIPGIGTIAGGAISAATASTLTVALGEAYIAVLATIFENDPDANPDVEVIASKLKEKLRGK